MRHFFVLMILLGGLNLQAQTATGSFPVKGKLVKVNEWGSLGVMMLGAYFKETKGEIVSKIGETEYAQLLLHCDQNGWPPEILSVYGYSPESEEKTKDKEVLRTALKMYQICTYTHKYNGNEFGKKAIIRVPYNENKNWKSGVKWEGNIYFILNESDVEALK